MSIPTAKNPGGTYGSSNYLEFAELQAISRKPMYMADWIGKLDEFLRLSDRDILTHTGTVSHEEAEAKAGLSTTALRPNAVRFLLRSRSILTRLYVR